MVQMSHCHSLVWLHIFPSFSLLLNEVDPHYFRGFTFAHCGGLVTSNVFHCLSLDWLSVVPSVLLPLTNVSVGHTVFAITH